MRRVFLGVAATLVASLLWSGQARAEKVEVKNVHMCCNACVKAIGETLGKVEGVTDANCDRPNKTVAFTAKDAKVAGAAVKALYDAGFYGTPSADGKALAVEAPAPKKGDKADEISVKNVHVCCMQCKNAISKLFDGSKCDFPGKNELKISGKGLDKAEIVETLRKNGFNGVIEK